MTTTADDRNFFEGRVRAEMDSLYGTALRLTRNAGEAEDLVAETVVRAWSALLSLEDRARFRPWLFRILTNTFVDSYRKKRDAPATEPWDDSGSCDDDGSFSLFERLHQPFLLWWGNPEQEYVNKLLREDIARAVDALPPAFRLAVILVDVEGFAYQEAAEALGVPVNTVRSRLKRGRACLQKALWKHAGDIGAVRSATEKA